MEWKIVGKRSAPTRDDDKAYWWALYCPLDASDGKYDTHSTKRIIQMEDENEWWITPSTGWNKEDDIGPFDSFDKAATVAEMLMAQEGEAA